MKNQDSRLGHSGKQEVSPATRTFMDNNSVGHRQAEKKPLKQEAQQSILLETKQFQDQNKTWSQWKENLNPNMT